MLQTNPNYKTMYINKKRMVQQIFLSNMGHADKVGGLQLRGKEAKQPKDFHWLCIKSKHYCTSAPLSTHIFPSSPSVQAKEAKELDDGPFY